MSEWKNTTIGELLTLQRGHDLVQTEFVDGDYLVAGSNGPIGYHNKYTTKGPGLTIGRSGNSIGAAHFYENDFWAHNTVLYSKVFHNSFPKFVYFLLKSFDFKSFDGGSAVPTLNRNHIHAIPISVPFDINEQKSIAEVLSSLDDKIDLLHRQNKTLEQLAETLFRQWFVEEAEESWVKKPLGNYVTIKRGGSPRPIHDFLSETGLNWLKISDVTGVDSPFIFEIKEKIREEGLSKTTLLKKGSLVLSNSATPGIPKILDVDSCIHDGWLHFPKSKFSKEFLYLFFKHIKPELIQLGNGSIFTNLKTDILKEYVLPIADDKSLTEFDEQIKTIFEKLYSNTTQIRTLTKLRDALLPKLMNGEVRVSNCGAVSLSSSGAVSLSNCGEEEALSNKSVKQT